MPRPTDTADVRSHNTAMILRYVVKQGTTSRAEVRRATGLVSGSVTSIVADLIGRGLLVESGEQVSTGGRPQRVISLVGNRVVGIAATVSAERIETEIVDLVGHVHWSKTVEYHSVSGDSKVLVDSLARALDEAWEAAAEVSGAWNMGTVIAAPGLMSRTSVLVYSISLGLRDLDLASELAKVLSHPQRIEVLNNGRLGALGELTALAGVGPSSASAYVASTTEGVFGGLVVGHNVVTGEHGFAGEVGHIVVNMDGPQCSCGARGCLDLYLSTSAMIARLPDGAAPIPSSLSPAQTLRTLAEAGDQGVLDVLSEAGKALAAAVATMTNYTDLGAVVLGGDLSLLDEWLVVPVDRLLKSRALVVPVFNPVIRRARFGARGPQVGAWVRLREFTLADPVMVPKMSAAGS